MDHDIHSIQRISMRFSFFAFLLSIFLLTFIRLSTFDWFELDLVELVFIVSSCVDEWSRSIGMPSFTGNCSMILSDISRVLPSNRLPAFCTELASERKGSREIRPEGDLFGGVWYVSSGGSVLVRRLLPICCFSDNVIHFSGSSLNSLSTNEKSNGKCSVYHSRYEFPCTKSFAVVLYHVKAIVP